MAETPFTGFTENKCPSAVIVVALPGMLFCKRKYIEC